MHRPIALAVLLLLTFGLTACDDPDAPTIGDDDITASPDPIADDGTDDETEGPTEAPSEEPTATEAPATEPPTFEEACAGREDEAFIEVLTPQAGSEVTQLFTVTGCGNTFEATYQYRVELPDGTVATEGFGTMSCGTGCVGEFEQEVTLEATGEVTLVVFETSAQDGSEQHVVEVPLIVS